MVFKIQRPTLSGLFSLYVLVCVSSIFMKGAERAPVKTVASVDLARYSGKWFEVGRIPNRFQKDCAGDVVAEYTLREDRTIRVVNRCRERDGGGTKIAEGVGRVAKEGAKTNSVLEVRFAPAFLSFLPAVWGDYRILSLGPNYEYAMVGSNDRKYLWLLSRQPAMAPEVYKRLLAEASTQGFASQSVVPTAQK